jgi:cytochrome P450
MQLPNTLKKPSFLQKLQWAVDPVGFMESATQEHPDIFTANVVGFGDTMVCVNHPQGNQELLTNDKKKLTAVGELNKILKPLVGNYSLLMLDGEQHKQRRQLLMPAFHGERMQAYGSLICNLTEQVYSQLPLHQPFLARNTMQEITLQVILQAVFGLYQGERYQKLKHLWALLMDLFQSPLNSSFLLFSFLQKDLGGWTPWGRFVRLRSSIHELVHAEIAERREKPDRDRIDILSLLMSSRDEAGNMMTDDELRDELMLMMISGNETAAITMAWALYWIHQKPEVHQKLIQELDTLGDSPDPMTIFRLPYLTAVCNETMRIHPSVMLTLPRVVQERVEIMGHPLEPGTVVVSSIYLTHRREDLYPEPEQFKPERFLERQFSAYEFLPFGGSARSCIGQALAQFEMKLVLATILSRYQLVLADRRPEKLQRRTFLLAPANGVKMIITGQRACQKPRATMVTTPAS